MSSDNKVNYSKRPYFSGSKYYRMHKLGPNFLGNINLIREMYHNFMCIKFTFFMAGKKYI